MIKITIINGPNLNLLGNRERHIYGTENLENIQKKISEKFNKIKIKMLQDNIEGEIVKKIHSQKGKIDGLIVNPGAYSYTSYAIRDAIVAAKIPTVEVHISNIYKRSKFRKYSVISEACLGQISGFGWTGYVLGISSIVMKLAEHSKLH